MFNAIQTRLFGGTSGTGWGGGALNSENIKATTTKFRGEIVRPKMSPLRSAT